MYELSVVVHVAAAVVGFGATFSYPVIHLLAERRNPHALPFALGAILAISRFVAVPATIVVGATGVYQVAAVAVELVAASVLLALVLTATLIGLALTRLGPRESFGEIALLRATPRTATVRAVGPALVYALDGAAFVAAVTGHAPSAAAAEAIVGERLGALRVASRRP